MKNEDPDIAAKAKKATVLDQGPVSLYKEASELESKITQATCIFVAMQVGAHSEIQAETSAGAAVRTNLAATFATLDQAIKDVGGEAFECFPDEVAELRKLIAKPSEEQQ